MPRRCGRVDANQAEIVRALRDAGCSVYVASSCGEGFPDLVVGRDGHNWLLEVKVARGAQTPQQVAFHAAWRGQYAVVRTATEALASVGL